MLELNKKVLKVKFNGAEYELKFPTVKQFREMSKQADKVDEYDSTMNFLKELGLPLDISEQLEISHIKALVEALTEQKKS